MVRLIAGLLIVITTHSLKLFAPAWRMRMMEGLGVWRWRLAPGEWGRTAAVFVLALLLWVGFIAGLHQWLIGVPPLVFSGN